MNNEGKNHFKILAVALAVILVVVAAVHWGLPSYRHFKERRSVTEAQVFLDHDDYRNAMLSARLALMLDSNNVPACRIMAGLADMSGAAVTLDWRQRIAELQPTPENKLALASAGLRYQSAPFLITSQILGQLADTSTNLVEYQSVATELALRMNHMAEAQSHLEIASQLVPTNKLFQLNLAVLRLNSTNPAVVNDARDALKQFSTDTNLGPSALRSLLAERLIHDDLPAAHDYSKQLLASAQANLGDHLQQLGILKRMQSPDLAGQLSILQQSAATNAVMAAQTAAWMQANGFLPESANWLNALPANVQNQTPVRLALVDYYLDTTNWQGLSEFTAKGDWQEMNFLRLAFLSHALNELGEPMMADGNWRSAVDLAGNQFGALNALAQLTGRWQMKAEQDDLLWRIAQKFPNQRWAAGQLAGDCFAAGDTARLNQLYSLLLASFPNEADIENNLAATSLLLKTNLPAAFRLAQAGCAQNPDDPSFVSTYAYALYLQGQPREGVAALEKLKSESLEKPSVALYYGVLLAALGENAKAAPYLALAATDSQLLPEEKQLLADTLKTE